MQVHADMEVRAPSKAEITFMERKYLFGLAGLVLSFSVAYFGTRSINNTGAGLPQTNAATQTSPSAANAPAPGSDTQDQQKGMSEVAGAVEKANNNPKDFDAQMEVASLNYQIGRYPKTVEYLQRAYDADPKKFAGQKGALSFIGQFYFDDKKFDESAKWFGRAIQEDSNDYVSKVFLSAIKKDARGAEEALDKFKQADPKSELLPALEDIVANVKAGKPLTDIKDNVGK